MAGNVEPTGDIWSGLKNALYNVTIAKGDHVNMKPTFFISN